MVPLRPTARKNFRPRLVSQNSMSLDDVNDYIMEIPDEVLSRLQFSVPWQYDTDEDDYKDPDDFKLYYKTEKEDAKATRDVLQLECWDKFSKNPQINTSVRGTVGRMTGMDFGSSCEIWEIQKVIDEIELDPRNRLYNFWPKWVGRYLVEGELFIVLTLHPDGFVEADFTDPSVLYSGGDNNTGIIFHPDKPSMPLFYVISDQSYSIKELIPSVYLARYPELLGAVSDTSEFKQRKKYAKKSKKSIYKKFNGFYRFMVSWDRGFMVRRTIGHLRTVIQWCNHYEKLKKYEIDYKKSAGAYIWAFKIENPRDFKLWLSLSDEDKRKTAPMAKKTPGSSLVLPPGMSVEAVAPKLPQIREEDTDILHMVGSGLNEPEDIMTGVSRGTFASVKESRGPMSDRISDEIAYFSRFLRYDFWGNIFFLRSSINKMDKEFSVKKAVGWKNQEPVFKKVKLPPERLIDFSFPTSEVIDYESRAKGMLGVKHGPMSETVGIPMSVIAKKLGIGSYGQMRLRKAEEDDQYPELIYTLDAESLQEQAESEPKKEETKKPTEGNNNGNE